MAYVLESNEVLDHILLSQISEKMSSAKRTYVIFELSEIGENDSLPENVRILHAPYDLIGGRSL